MIAKSFTNSKIVACNQVGKMGHGILRMVGSRFKVFVLPKFVKDSSCRIVKRKKTDYIHY